LAVPLVRMGLFDAKRGFGRKRPGVVSLESVEGSERAGEAGGSIKPGVERSGTPGWNKQ